VRLERGAASPKTGPVRDVEEVGLPVFDRFAPTDSWPVPEAFLVPASEEDVAELLKRHGVLVERLDEPWSGPVDEFVVRKAEQSAQPFQQVRLLSIECEARLAEHSAAAGDFVVSTRQALGALVFHVLHPAGLDGAGAWGFLGDAPEPGSVWPVRAANLGVAAAKTAWRPGQD
jgi:hypothetical protein